MKVHLIAIVLLASACVPDPGQEVTAAEYGDDWPFTVAAGRVDCLPSGSLVFVADGTPYALTGLARAKGYRAVDPIWRDNPRIQGTKVPLQPITAAAEATCG